MRDHQYLVTTRYQNHHLPMVWDPKEVLELDHPSYWRLTLTPAGPRIVDPSGQALEVDPEALLSGSEIALPDFDGKLRAVHLRIQPITKLRPAFLPLQFRKVENYQAGDHFYTVGIHELAISFEKVTDTLEARIEEEPVFKLYRAGGFYIIHALSDGVRLRYFGQSSRPIAVASSLRVTEAQMVNSALFWGSYWWRINSIPEPSVVPGDELDHEKAERDLYPYKKLWQVLGSVFLSIILLMRLQFAVDQNRKLKEPKKETPVVELKKPKLIEKAPEVIKPPEPKKPEPKKPTASKPKAKAEPKPKLNVAPPPAAKIPPPPQALPKVVAPPPPAPVKAKAPAPQTPSPAQVTAQQKASLSKSLNFLSSTTAKPAAPLAQFAGAKAAARYDTKGVAGPADAPSALNKLSKESAGDGMIATKGARNVNAGVTSSGAGKALNEVQGRVSLAAISGGGDLAGAMSSGESGGSMSVSGQGKLSDAAIAKTLAKYLQRFQYCYEKALLSDSSLSGVVTLQWTINLGGAVSSPSVVKSAMNHRGLHDCLMKEVSKITFPSPSGGSVTIKYPFNFSANTL